MEEFGVRGSGCGRICYLRNIADADHLLACISAVKQEAEPEKGGDAASGTNKVTDGSPDSSGRSMKSLPAEVQAQSHAECNSSDQRVSLQSDSAHQSSPCSPRAVVIGGGYIGKYNAAMSWTERSLKGHNCMHLSFSDSQCPWQPSRFHSSGSFSCVELSRTLTISFCMQAWRQLPSW